MFPTVEAVVMAITTTEDSTTTITEDSTTTIMVVFTTTTMEDSTTIMVVFTTTTTGDSAMVRLNNSGTSPTSLLKVVRVKTRATEDASASTASHSVTGKNYCSASWWKREWPSR